MANMTMPQGHDLAVTIEDEYREEKGRERGDTSAGETLGDSSEDGEKVVHDLARAFTQHSIKNPNGDHVNPFDGSDNPLLDPASGKFSYKVWTKNLLGVQSRDPERYPSRVAGVSYKNLSAHGFGEATDYQKTFGNYPLEGASIFKKLIGRGQKKKIQILRNFDGLVRSGEMLVVFGRPGRYVVGCGEFTRVEVDWLVVDVRPCSRPYQERLTVSSLIPKAPSTTRVFQWRRCTKTSEENASTRQKLMFISPN